MKEHQREQLLERIEREGATIGHDIPETINIDDTPFELHAFVFETKKQEDVSKETQERVDEVKRTLRRARNRRIESIEEDDISYDTGETLTEEIIGIDRALDALRDLGPTDIEQEIKRKEAVDKKRWLDFLDDALDADTSRFS